MPLTIDNWYHHLLSITDRTFNGPQIHRFNTWCRDEGLKAVPFHHIAWYRNGHCCAHNDLYCRLCATTFGGLGDGISSAATPPSTSYRPLYDAWRHYRQLFDTGARVMREQQAGWETISVPVLKTSGGPHMQQSEVYVFPVEAKRIRIHDEIRSFSCWARVPDMSIRDVLERLCGSSCLGREVWLRWRGRDGVVEEERLLRREASSVFREMGRGHRTRRGREALDGDVEKTIVIRRVGDGRRWRWD